MRMHPAVISYCCVLKEQAVENGDGSRAYARRGTAVEKNVKLVIANLTDHEEKDTTAVDFQAS